MLNETTIQIPLVKGIDTKTDPKVSPVGDLVTLENGVFTSPGKIRKRNGGANLLTGITTSTKAVIPYGETLVVVDGDSHLQLKVGSSLIDKGAIPSITARPTGIARNTSQAQTSPDGAYHVNTGREMFVWEEDGSIHYRIVDASTNVQLADGVAGVGRCMAPRVVELGTGWLVLYWRFDTVGVTGQLRYALVNASTMVFGGDSVLSSYAPDLGKIASQRACLDVRKESSGYVTVSFPIKSGSYTLPCVDVFHTDGTFDEYLTTSYTTADVKCITARTLTDKLVCVWQDQSDQIRLTEIDRTLGTVSDKGVLATVTNVHSMSMSGLVYLAPGNVVGNRHLVLISKRPQDPVDHQILSLTIQEASGTYSLPYSIPQTVATGLCLASGVSNPVSGKYTFVAAHESNEQSTYFLYEYNDEVILDGDRNIVARILSGVAGPPPARSSLPQIYTRLSDYGFACTEQTALGSAPKDGLFALTSVDRVVIGQGASVKSAPAANGLLVALGDLLMLWDGASLTEHGFHLYPDVVKLPAITTSGHTWQYCACYSWMDHHGQIHRSAASTPVTYTSSSAIDDTHTVAVQVPGLSVTRKEGVQVELYRTKDGGTDFYRLVTLANADGWISYTDSNTDSIVEGITEVQAPTGLTAVASPALITSPGFNSSTKITNVGGAFADTQDNWFLLTVLNRYGETTGQATSYRVAGGGTATPFAVNLSWTQAGDAFGYRIYWAATTIGGLEPDDSAHQLVANVNFADWQVNIIDSSPPPGLGSIPPPSANTTSPGSLSAGHKYYRVSSINQNGETVPCAEVDVDNTTSAVDLSWQRVPNATGYRVYGRSTGAQEYMAEVQGVDETTWHDDGSITPSGAMPGANTTGSARQAVIGNIQLYTSGGIVDNMPPPPVAWIATGKSRVFIADAENPNRVCFSHEILPGQPVEFAPTHLSVQVDPTGGDVVAVQPMDEKILCLKESSIYAFAGQGPSRTGLDSDYGQPQIIAGDCGCSSASSCVLMPAGVMFQSSKGIMLLDRALGLGYIGAPVEAYNAEMVNSGVLVAAANHVRMATSSRVLVYDYHIGAWATFAISGVKSSCIYGGKWTYGLSTSVIQENSGFTDPGDVAISLKLKTAWINFAGVAGFARARRLALLGSYLSAHLLRVRLYVTPSDNSATAVQDETFTANSGELHRIPLTQQKFSALQVEIWDDFTGLSPGEGYDISALAFEVGMKPRLAKLSSSKTY